jgi:glycosyltransferase involved in cell wall biosynthesis
VDGRGAVEPSVLVLFRDSPLRRAALDAPIGSGERYALFGADTLSARGFATRHSLEPDLAPRRRHRRLDRALRGVVGATGGYAGDFATVLASRREANSADVVLSTVDTVGIPAVLLGAARLLRSPLVYVSIGLPHRLAQLRNGFARRAYERAFRRTAAIVAYGHAEAEELRAWLPGHDVRFVPFGVDAAAFAPHDVEPETDVVSVGMDPERDYALLSRVAAALPERSFSVVASADQARSLGGANVAVAAELPFAETQARIARARVVALPVRDNLYSGATTTLLQAMAAGKPVVVSRTAAIAEGYNLEDGVNVRLVAPGDEVAFAGALQELLADEDSAAALGRRARESVERDLGWDRYVDRMADVLRGARSQT